MARRRTGVFDALWPVEGRASSTPYGPSKDGRLRRPMARRRTGVFDALWPVEGRASSAPYGPSKDGASSTPYGPSKDGRLSPHYRVTFSHMGEKGSAVAVFPG